jgi:hypothetical protein
MQDSKGINSLKQARELLEKHAIKGEHLAYINKDEAKLLKYMGGAGIPVNSSGIPSYFIKKAFKAVTKPIAKVLDKIVPNEIKPALPYLAAFAPMLAGAGYLGAGLSSLTPVQSALLGAGANVISQSAQEGAAKYGINPLSVGLASLGGYLSAPSASSQLAAGKVAGNISTAGGASIPISPDALSNLSGSFDPVFGSSMLEAGQTLSPPTFLQSAENLARNVAQSGADFIGKGTDALSRGDVFSKDFGMAAIGPAASATGDLAYNSAMKALDEYDQQQAALGAMGVANTEARKSAIRKAMGLAGYTDPEIETTLLKFKFATGGRVGYQMGGGTKPPAMPINPEMLALAIYGKRYDELTYTQKSAIADMLPNKKAEGGIMDLGGMEMDYRAKGGFVPIGEKEKADDVPARLSKNEFVFTADAVRGAGKGDIKKGAKKMYQLMKQYEAIA